ncbi:MAG: methyltransferase [Myxococcaceae bacterium]
MTPDPLRALATKALPAQLFLAGFCGLVFEVVWTRRLHNLLGTSGQAQAVALASFMGGLALGAWLFSRLADRPSADPLRDSRMLFGGTQIALAVWAFAFRFILHAVESAWLSSAGGEGAGREVLRVVFAAVALVPAAVWVGAAFPLVFRVARASGSQVSVAGLYAIDGLGAAFGTLVGGLLLLPTDGLTATEQKAAFFALLNGLFSLLAARGVSGPLPQGAEGGPTGRETSDLNHSAARAALLVTAMAGFAAMLHQLAWTRLLTTMIGGSTYAFTLILAAFVLGIGLGSWWLSRRKPFANPLAALARAQWLLVLSICIALPTYARLPYVFLQLQWALRRGTHTFFLYELLTFGLCGALVLIPALFMGASFPLAAETVIRGRTGTARPLGSAYLWNTAGTVLGALLGGLVLLPLLGLEGAFALGLLLNLFAAAGAAWNGAGRRGPALAPIAATSVFLGLVALTSMGWSSFAAASGRGREWDQAFESFEAFRTEVARRAEVRFQRDDSFGNVLVGESKSGERYLRINGKLEVSNGTTALIPPVLAGHLGFFTGAKENGRVLLVGLGSGITAGALLTHPIERLDVVEISPAVADAAKYFASDNHAALDDPRLHLHLEDAKTFLSLSKDQYDLIVSAPPSPGASGDVGLFTIDFFRAAKAHLAQGGRLVQVVKADDLGEPLLKLFMRTVRDSFPHGSSWLGPKDLLVVGSLEPQKIDFAALAQQLAQPKVADDVARALVLDVPTLLALQVHSDQGQAALAGTGALNTDDRNRLEFGAPVAHYAGEAFDLHDERRSKETTTGLELEQWLRQQPLDASQAEHVWRALSATHLPQDALVRSSADAWLTAAPESIRAKVAVARSAWAQTEAAAVRELLAPVVRAGERDPDVIALWLRSELAEAKRSGALWNPVDLEEPLRIAKEVVAKHPEHAKLAQALEEAAK